jgi:hypothetical protein
VTCFLFSGENSALHRFAAILGPLATIATTCCARLADPSKNDTIVGIYRENDSFQSSLRPVHMHQWSLRSRTKIAQSDPDSWKLACQLTIWGSHGMPTTAGWVL